LKDDFSVFESLENPRKPPGLGYLVRKNTGWSQKLAHFVLYTLTSSNVGRFSNLFYCKNQENIFNNTVTKDLTTPQLCRYTVSVLKATIENKDDFYDNKF